MRDVTPLQCRLQKLRDRFVFCALITIACGCTGSDSSDEQNQVSDDSNLRQQVSLIVSGDTQGWLIPCGCTSNQSGGMLRRGAYLAQLRSNSDLIYVDVGGAADGNAPYQLEKFKAILEAETLSGVDAHNLGATEIGFGVESLKDLEQKMAIPFVSCNVFGSVNQLVTQAIRIIQRGGQRILVTGVVSPSFAGSEIVVAEPAESILNTLADLDGKYDRLVVLAYLPENELHQLAERLPEADAIVGGPTGQSLSPRHVGHVLLTSATNKGKFLAHLDLPADVSQKVSAKIVEMSPDYEDHVEQKQNLQQFRQLLAKRDFTASESGLVEQTLASSATSQQVAGTQACVECHQETCEHWDSTGHAHAWDRLRKEEGAHVDPYCQQCHTTNYGFAGGFQSVSLSPDRVNVGCESCHGPSLDHSLGKGSTSFDAVGQCLKCHDPENSPTFEYDSFWEQIRHE